MVDIIISVVGIVIVIFFAALAWWIENGPEKPDKNVEKDNKNESQ